MTRRFPTSAGIVLGLGLGGFFDGIVFHQILQWHHIASSAGVPTDTVAGLQRNVLLDGLFHAATYALMFLGLLMLWWHGRRDGILWSWRALIGTLLMGFGLFNLVEGLVNHQILGLHHVNETVPQADWPMWDMGFLGSGLALFVLGWALWRRGIRRRLGATY